MTERTQISVCTMKSHALTHLVLVREVVGIKGLRGEKPPEEKNSVKQTGFKDGIPLSHTHKNHQSGYLKHTQILNRIPSASA